MIPKYQLLTPLEVKCFQKKLRINEFNLMTQSISFAASKINDDEKEDFFEIMLIFCYSFKEQQLATWIRQYRDVVLQSIPSVITNYNDLDEVFYSQSYTFTSSQSYTLSSSNFVFP